MPLGAGIAMIALGFLFMMLVHATVGIIFLVIGALLLILGFAGVGPYGGRRDVVIERERRPPRRERETIRETEL